MNKPSAYDLLKAQNNELANAILIFKHTNMWYQSKFYNLDLTQLSKKDLRLVCATMLKSTLTKI